MSNLSGDDRTAQQESTQQKQKGPEAFLTNEERKDLQRSLSYPEDLPPKFKNWIQEYIAVNIPQIPISQIVGFSQFRVISAPFIFASEITSLTAYTNLGTIGPEISGLSDGQYVLWYGCAIDPSVAAEEGAVSVSINDAAASDNDGAVVEGVNRVNVSISVLKTLSAGGNNKVTLKYKTLNGNSTAFARRWLIALKT